MAMLQSVGKFTSCDHRASGPFAQRNRYVFPKKKKSLLETSFHFYRHLCRCRHSYPPRQIKPFKQICIHYRLVDYERIVCDSSYDFGFNAPDWIPNPFGVAYEYSHRRWKEICVHPRYPCSICFSACCRFACGSHTAGSPIYRPKRTICDQRPVVHDFHLPLYIGTWPEYRHRFILLLT